MPGHRAKRLGVAKPPNGSRPQFAPGNAVGTVHGAGAPRLRDPVALAIVAEMRLVQPAYLSDASFDRAVDAWGQAEARLLLFSVWMDQLDEEDRYTAKGDQRPPVLIWRELDAHAALHRARLGLDPVSRVKIGKALTSAGVDLAKLAAAEAGDGWTD